MSISELLITWHDRFLGYTTDLKFDKTNPVDLNLVALYGSIIEFTLAIIILLNNKGRTALPSVFRSLLESSVELRNLSADHDYLNYMRASHVEQWLKVFKEANKNQNPFLSKIAEMDELAEVVKQHEEEFESLRAAGYKPLNIFERFEKAGMIEEYRSLYNFLSCDAHSNTRALISRHFEAKEDGFEVVYYKDEPIETFLPTLDSTAALLQQASVTIHECFESPHVQDVRNAMTELETVRAEYVANGAD